MLIIFRYSVLVLLCFIFIHSVIRAPENHSLELLTDSTFDLKVNTAGNEKWIVLFYLDNCPHSEKVLTEIEEILSSNSSLKKNFHFGKVECSRNVWTAIRFNIAKLPYIILIEKDLIYEYHYHPDQPFSQFLSDGMLIKAGKPIPPKLSSLAILFRMFKEGCSMVNDIITDLLYSTLGIQWDYHYTNVVLVLVVLLVIYMAYKRLVHFFYSTEKISDEKLIQENLAKKNE